MNRKQIAATCLSISTLVAMGLPALALKSTPSSDKKLAVKAGKIKCAKIKQSGCIKSKVVPVKK